MCMRCMVVSIWTTILRITAHRWWEYNECWGYDDGGNVMIAWTKLLWGFNICVDTIIAGFQYLWGYDNITHNGTSVMEI